MPRKQAKRAVPPKAPKSGRANATGGEHPQRHIGQDETIAERRLRAFKLRKSGASYRQIAEFLDVSVNTAWADVNAELLELREQTRFDVQEVRELELQRCDEMLMGLWAGVKAGDAKAVIAACKVSERRSKLLGLDTKRVEHSGTLDIGGLRTALSGRIAGLAARLGAGVVARGTE
jgi:DNA-binding CsgD family transcriptional regulator